MAGNAETISLDQGKAMTAMLAILIAQREDQRADEDAEDRSTETILSLVGLSDPEIGSLVGKTANAVRKTRYRDRDRAEKISKSKKGS